jgi:hypothetical protein
MARIGQILGENWLPEYVALRANAAAASSVCCQRLICARLCSWQV